MCHIHGLGESVVTNTGQVVAALAGGALLAIATMLTIRLRTLERRAEQQRRIDTAVDSIVGGIHKARSHYRPPDERPSEEAPDEDAEVHTKAHLRLITPAPSERAAGRRSRPTGRSGSASVRRR